MSQMGFEPTIPAGERPQTYALGRAATGTGISLTYVRIFVLLIILFGTKMKLLKIFEKIS